MTFERVVFWSGIWNVGLGLILITPPIREFLGLHVPNPFWRMHRCCLSLVYGSNAHSEFA